MDDRSLWFGARTKGNKAAEETRQQKKQGAKASSVAKTGKSQLGQRKAEEMLGDRKVIEEITGRNERVFEMVVNQYSRLLWKVAASVLFSSGACEVEECVADAFIYLWEHPEKYQPERGKLSTYLAAIARSRAIDRYRKLCREREIHLDDLMMGNGLQGIVMEHVTAPSADEERVQKLHDCMERLDEEEREIIIRRFFHEQKVSDIALAMGWKSKQVENKIFQTKRKLRKWMEE